MVIKKSIRQIGKSNLSRDRLFKAKMPGKRVSKSGNVYYEYRRNRTDVKGRDTPIKTSKSIRTKLNRLKNFINNVVKDKKQREIIYSYYLPLPTGYKFSKAKDRILKLIESKKIKIKRNSNEIEIKRQIAWEEKQKNKISRLKKSISKYKYITDAAFNASTAAVRGIPFGQPILIGHHSQRTHENALKKSWNNMKKSIKASETAEILENRLKSLSKSNQPILSDDPMALKKLNTKLKNLEEKRLKYKEYNKKARKDKSLKPLASYHLTNLGANIRTIKGRIKNIEASNKIGHISKKKKGLKLVTNEVAQRVQLIFDNIPEKELRSKLKKSGYRWSPKYNAWQKKITVINVSHANNFYNDYPKIDGAYYRY